MKLRLPFTSDLHNGITLYGKGDYLNRQINRNNISLRNYADEKRWDLFNQHPLVQFLILLSLDPKWTDDYIYNRIAYCYNQVASTCKMTSLRNPGISFNHVLFPEKEHQTLIVVPFKNEIVYSDYFKLPLEELFPLTTLFTTDTKLRYDTTSLTTDIVSVNKSDYTVVQLDPFLLGIGYVRYCRENIERGSDISLSASHYISTLPLANFFIQHNQNVILNLIEGDGISIESTKWNKLDITKELSEYLAFLRRESAITVFKSFNHYFRLLDQNGVLGGRLYKSLYPDNGSSDMFSQLSWAYNYGTMYWSYRYLYTLKKYGKYDDVFSSNVKRFLINNIGALTGSIQNPLWRHLYISMFNDLKEIVS